MRHAIFLKIRASAVMYFADWTPSWTRVVDWSRGLDSRTELETAFTQ